MSAHPDRMFPRRDRRAPGSCRCPGRLARTLRDAAFALALAAAGVTLALAEADAPAPPGADAGGAPAPASAGGGREAAASGEAREAAFAGVRPNDPVPQREVRRVVVEDHTILESLALAAHALPSWVVLAAALGAMAGATGLARGIRAPSRSAPLRPAAPPRPSRPAAGALPLAREALAGARFASEAPAVSTRVPAVPRNVAPGPAGPAGAGRCTMAAADPALAARLRERYLQVRFLGEISRESDLANAALVAHAARRFLNNGHIDRAFELADLAGATHPQEVGLQLVNLEISFVARDAERFARIARALGPKAGPVVRQVIRGLGRQLVPGRSSLADDPADGVATVAFGDPAREVAGAASATAADSAALRLALDADLRTRLLGLPVAFACRDTKVA